MHRIRGVIMRCVYMSPSVLTGSLHDTRPLEGKKKFYLKPFYACIHAIHASSLIFSFFVLFLTVSTLKKQKWRKTPELGTFLKDTHQPGASSRTSILNKGSYHLIYNILQISKVLICSRGIFYLHLIWPRVVQPRFA